MKKVTLTAAQNTCAGEQQRGPPSMQPSRCSRQLQTVSWTVSLTLLCLTLKASSLPPYGEGAQVMVCIWQAAWQLVTDCAIYNVLTTRCPHTDDDAASPDGTDGSSSNSHDQSGPPSSQKPKKPQRDHHSDDEAEQAFVDGTLGFFERRVRKTHSSMLVMSATF